jgi:hypothetical protein
VSVSPPAVPSAKFSRANVRRIALSALKGFLVAAGTVVVAKKADLTSGHLSMSIVQAVAFQAVFAGGAAAAKVVEVFLED